jgi:DNA polymerase IV
MRKTTPHRMALMRSIVHVDMDAFYAAIEQRDQPALRGLPVIIGHTGPRGVVSTASYEARVFGVRSAMPSARALKLCPNGVFVEPRLGHYAMVSKEIFAVFAQTTPEIEGLSLDEAFLDVTASLSLFGSVQNIATFIREEVYKRTELRCSVGIAHNKLLAKMASELGKPNGLLHLMPEQVQARLDPLPVGRLYTIGKVAVEKLAAVGIGTIGQLRQAPRERVRRALGNHAEVAQQFAAGIDTRPVCANREEKSVGAESTFDVDINTIAQARMWLMRLSEKTSARLRAHDLQAQTITVKLRVPPFETMTRQAPLTPASAATDAIFQLADKLLGRWWQQQKQPSLRLLGVSASRFDGHAEPVKISAEEVVQADLFAPAPAAEAPLETIARKQSDALRDAITKKFGANSLRRARGIAPQG